MDLRKLIRKTLTEAYGPDVVKVDFSTQKIMLGNTVIGQLEIYLRDTPDENKYLILDKVFIEKDYRGKGYGEQAMKQLINYADKNNFIITLTPDTLWGANKTKLINWYKSLGFIMNKGKNKDYQTMQLMYKLPSKLEEMIGFKQFNVTGSRAAFPGIPSEFPNPSNYDTFGNPLDVIKR